MSKNIYGNPNLTLEECYCIRIESEFEQSEEQDNQLCLFDIYEAIKRGVSDEHIGTLVELYNEHFNEVLVYDTETKELVA